MTDCHILHGSHNDVHVLRFIGDIRYTVSPSIERYLEKIFTGKKPAGFVIDLSETDSIDSTNLGLLVRIARRMQALDAPRVTVISSRPGINSVLSSMALDEVFDIVEDSTLESGVTREVPQQSDGREVLARSLVESHRSLMELNERNREMFKDVVSSLEKNRPGG
jgi:anti-anti-sigma factor